MSKNKQRDELVDAVAEFYHNVRTMCFKKLNVRPDVINNKFVILYASNRVYNIEGSFTLEIPILRRHLHWVIDGILTETIGPRTEQDDCPEVPILLEIRSKEFWSDLNDSFKVEHHPTVQLCAECL